MTIAEMLGQSGILAVLGMGVVFSFLWIMVICVNLIGKYFRFKEGKNTTVNTTVNTGRVPPEHIAAISAAIVEYQNNDKKMERRVP